MSTNDAGRELDKVIAEQVMGLAVRKIWVVDASPHSDYGTVGEPYTMDDGRKGVQATTLPHYSTQIGDAWLVVEKLRERGVCLDIADQRHGCYLESRDGPPFVGFFIDISRVYDGDDLPTDLEITASASTAPHAICLAALTAIAHAPEPAHAL